NLIFVAIIISEFIVVVAVIRGIIFVYPIKHQRIEIGHFKFGSTLTANDTLPYPRHDFKPDFI
ncbi:MAG: hypothetical protein WBG05_00355, partial [Thermoanaerobaculia bacterium]